MTSNTVQPKIRLDAEQFLTNAVEQALVHARQLGATEAEASAADSHGLSVTVRLNELETIEHNHDTSLQITVYFGHKLGTASTSDLSTGAIKKAVDAACSIARYTAEDPCFGLADSDLLAYEFPNLDLYHPYSLSTESAIELALQTEQAAMSYDKRITNSEGATISSQDGIDVYGNTNHFLATRPHTRYSRSCSVIAQQAGGMQRDYWYDTKRDFLDLETAERIGNKAARRAIRRLEARKLKTCKAPVIFEAPVAASLLSHFISAISGGNLYRQTSFLVDHLGKKIFPDNVTISENPLIPKALGSAAYDQEGVATHKRDIVEDGILKGYVLNSYSARKLGLTTTGNAGGIHNLDINHSSNDLPDLITSMGTGLLLTELIGFGVNTVTGDYSRGASGLWIEDGEIKYPVEEITIAGNLKEMYRNFLDVGNDIDIRKNIRTGSILLESLTIAGN